MGNSEKKFSYKVTLKILFVAIALTGFFLGPLDEKKGKEFFGLERR